MARVDPRQVLMPSIVDRLIEPESSSSLLKQGFDLRQIIDAVRRDLEDLLNSHQMYAEDLEPWPELSKSLVVYGVPDVTALSAVTEANRQAICKVLEESIQRFEPRLRNVRARLLTEKTDRATSLRFHLDAQINVDPAPEIAFETVLELISGRASIKPSEGSE